MNVSQEKSAKKASCRDKAKGISGATGLALKRPYFLQCSIAVDLLVMLS